MHPAKKFLRAGKRPVLRHIGPDRIVALDRVPQRCGVLNSELFDTAVAAVERHRTGTFGRRGVDGHANWLSELRMSVVSHDFGRRGRSSWKNLFKSAFDVMPAKLSNFPSCAICRAD